MMNNIAGIQIFNTFTGKIRLLLLAPLLITSLSAQTAHGFYLRITTGYDFALESTWRDTNSTDKTAVPVYGDGYFAKGHAGNSPAIDLALGYELSSNLALEFGMSLVPRIGFKGNVNYPNAGDHQPVSARQQAIFISLGTRIQLLSQHERPSLPWLNPYVRLATGLSVNHTDSVEMSFPDLVHPHTFVTPQGRIASFYYGLSAGNAFRVGPRLALDIEMCFNAPGRTLTSAGEAKIIRSDRTIPIPVNETEAWMKTLGLRIGLRYHFQH